MQGCTALGPSRTGLSSQPSALAGIRACPEASAEIRVPGWPQNGGHGKSWGRAGLGPAVEPVTHSSRRFGDQLLKCEARSLPRAPPPTDAGRGAGQAGAGSRSQLCLCSWGPQEERSEGLVGSPTSGSCQPALAAVRALRPAAAVIVAGWRCPPLPRGISQRAPHLPRGSLGVSTCIPGSSGGSS